MQPDLSCVLSAISELRHDNLVWSQKKHQVLIKGGFKQQIVFLTRLTAFTPGQAHVHPHILRLGLAYGGDLNDLAWQARLLPDHLCCECVSTD